MYEEQHMRFTSDFHMQMNTHTQMFTFTHVNASTHGLTRKHMLMHINMHVHAYTHTHIDTRQVISTQYVYFHRFLGFTEGNNYQIKVGYLIVHNTFTFTFLSLNIKVQAITRILCLYLKFNKIPVTITKMRKVFGQRFSDP